MPRLSTDDDVYRFRAVWLGPRGKRFGFEARYLAWAIGTLCWVLATPAVFTLARVAPLVLVGAVGVVAGVGLALLLNGSRALGLVWAAAGSFLTLLVAGVPPVAALLLPPALSVLATSLIMRLVDHDRSVRDWLTVARQELHGPRGQRRRSRYTLASKRLQVQRATR